MRAASLAVLVMCCGCGSPPPSQFPSAADAIARMRATYACSRGLTGEAKIDYYDAKGRAKGNLLFVAMRPDRLRFDVFSPFGATLSTLTSDGKKFSLYDLREKRFLYGPANTCNVARFTRVPVPPHALVGLLGGEAPVLKHAPGQATIAWKSGEYIVTVAGDHQATEEIHLVPTPADWERPWAEQRLRVLEVKVAQAGIDLYHAELRGHEAAHTAAPLVDEEAEGPPVPPSGPSCDAEVPRRLRLEVPETEQDVLIAYQEVKHNPPLDGKPFTQPPPGGVSIEYAVCR